MSRKANMLLTLFIVLALAASVSVVVRRAQVEQSSNSVEIILDYDDAREYATSVGYPLDEFLIKMRDAGVTSIGLHEGRIRDLVDKGNAILLAGDGADERFISASFSSSLSTAIGRARANKAKSILILPKADWVIGFVKYLTARLLDESVTTELVNDPSGARYIISSSADPIRLSRQRYGLDRNQVTALRQLGFSVVPRYSNFKGHNPRLVGTMLEQLDWVSEGSLVVFDGRDVLGYQRDLHVTSEALSHYKARLGIIELAGQRGIETLAKDLDYQAIRVHSVSSGEMKILSIETIVERYIRAARERGIRAMYVRPIPEKRNAVKFVSDNRKLIMDLVAGLKKAGFTVGLSHPFDKLSTAFPLLLLISLGVCASFGMLLWHLVGASPLARVGVAILGLAIFLLLSLSGRGILARQLMALVASLTLPSLAVISQSYTARKSDVRPKNVNEVIRRSLALLVSTSVLSLAGGLMIAGLLGDTIFMLKLQQFVGVKLMHVVPVAIVAWVILGGRDQIKSFRHGWMKLRQAYMGSIPIKYLVWLCIAGLLGLVYLARTGNESSVPVLGIERDFRSFLEHVLIARPRTKEFLFAHPLMMLGFALAIGGYQSLSISAFLLGTIGQASIANTFSHIHSPIIMAVARWGYAVILGGVIGIAVILLVDAAIKRYGKNPDGICRDVSSRKIGMKAKRLRRGGRDA